MKHNIYSLALFPAFCLTLMFFAGYASAWAEALTWLLYAWTHQYLEGEKQKTLSWRVNRV